MHSFEPPRDPALEAEQFRITTEFMQDTKPSKHGWIVVLVFLALTAAALVIEAAQEAQGGDLIERVNKCRAEAGNYVKVTVAGFYK